MQPCSRTRAGTASSASSSSVSGRNGSNLALRLMTAGIGIPLVVAVNYVGGWAFACAVGTAAIIAMVEIYGLFRRAHFAPAYAVGLPAGVAFAVLPILQRGTEEGWIALVAALVLVAGTLALARGSDAQRLNNWALTVVGSIYVGLLLGHLSLMRVWTHGAWWVLFVFLITWGYDTGAYVAGRLFGSRPFMHHISPKKTLEGVFGGLVVSALAGCVGAPTLGMTVWQALLIGLAGGVAAQAGDLIESMIKRQTGAKDSGSLMPGHGGLLDRIDSLLFTATMTVYVVRVFGYGA